MTKKEQFKRDYGYRLLRMREYSIQYSCALHDAKWNVRLASGHPLRKSLSGNFL